MITNSQIRRSIWLILALSFAAGLWAQQAQQAAAKYQPTKEQSLELRALRAEAQLAQVAAQQAQQAFSAKLLELTDKGKEFQRANKWPDTVTFDPNSLSYVDAPPPAPPTTKEPKK
jgi:hypothetical protein